MPLGRRRDALLFLHIDEALGSLGGLLIRKLHIGGKPGPTPDLDQQRLVGKLVDIPADGGLGAVRMGHQILNGNDPSVFHQLKNGLLTFGTQHNLLPLRTNFVIGGTGQLLMNNCPVTILNINYSIIYPVMQCIYGRFFQKNELFLSKTDYYRAFRYSLTVSMNALTRASSTAFSNLPSYLKVVAQTAPSEFDS